MVGSIHFSSSESRVVWRGARIIICYGSSAVPDSCQYCEDVDDDASHRFFEQLDILSENSGTIVCMVLAILELDFLAIAAELHDGSPGFDIEYDARKSK